ncbi:hypothetical protein RRG08_028960 [Elysia crispata]|uniref:Uncharacterized protein n=1 Tax=Elysia crispata TaxID=231223 RepID=A0AAE1APU8_9GAST|nr:hypothetical protein RRG08_028960 [Elysia crispata]
MKRKHVKRKSSVFKDDRVWVQVCFQSTSALELLNTAGKRENQYKQHLQLEKIKSRLGNWVSRSLHLRLFCSCCARKKLETNYP